MNQMNNDLKNVGVIFVNKKLTTKKGTEYYSGRTDDAPDGEFNLMAFIRESKSGSKYLSIVEKDSNRGSAGTAHGGSDSDDWDNLLSEPH